MFTALQRKLFKDSNCTFWPPEVRKVNSDVKKMKFDSQVKYLVVVGISYQNRNESIILD